MEQGTFQLFLGAMSIIALFVFIALYFVKAGYECFELHLGAFLSIISWRGC